MASTLPKLPIFEAISKHDRDSTAVVHSLSGRRFRYGGLLADVCKVRNRLYDASGRDNLDGERIAFLVENSYDYVVTLLAILAARSIAVPLAPGFPPPELQYILDHSEAALLLSSAKFAKKAQDVIATGLASKPAHLELAKFETGSTHEEVSLGDANSGGAGMMLYTSGTTNRPKGVLLPQAVMTAQAQSLLKAWEYSSADHLLHVLPLHHIHGTINAVFAPLMAGSSIEFLFPFNADFVWRRLAAPFLPKTGYSNGTNGATNARPGPEKITFFTVVPTVYSRLLATHKALTPELQEAGRAAVSPANMRLSISGSAALPTPIKKAWAALSGGTVLLERYGMTEARLVDVDTGTVIQPGEELDQDGRERAGEIQLRGPTIFAEYWRNPEATAKEFVHDSCKPDETAANGHAHTTNGYKTNGHANGLTNGHTTNGHTNGYANGSDSKWFKTGDVAVRRPVPGAGENDSPGQEWTRKGPMYFILGRKSADIIKSGGEKVSALEVERELLSLPQVAEAAVCAVPSGKWGQKVGCVIVLDRDSVPEGARWTPMDMRRALKTRLVNYKIPQVMRVVEHIPRNAMGKINKKQLVQAVFQDDFSGDEM
ncbi:2-succinylbenzoate-CoA ligase [Magnaporthiopsis poae ATCC 64411]|uniref:2-succinylbenzoate-CoA ligase n=1 Tax=Magnaporthiopsis poae (strain ATCC 64411 / 73-15) TaxID=644358 RepID=A0A0C4E343_MAGP6|nr:2-succinylbenzoate-CoA ligase [Magnaporthiopsis poae ATCC 64411]